MKPVVRASRERRILEVRLTQRELQPNSLLIVLHHIKASYYLAMFVFFYYLQDLSSSFSPWYLCKLFPYLVALCR